MTFTPTSSTCALHGVAGCFRRFAKSPKPRYVYDKRKVKNTAGVTCTVPWCVCVHPKPQAVTDAKCAHCPDWRDRAGRDAETVRQLMTDGRYEG